MPQIMGCVMGIGRNGLETNLLGQGFQIPTGGGGSPNPSSLCPLPLSWVVEGNTQMKWGGGWHDWHAQCYIVTLVTTQK